MLLQIRLRQQLHELHHRVVAVYIPEHDPPSIDEVSLYIRRLPDKSSAANPIPTSVLKDVADFVAPYIVHLFNTSIAAGRFTRLVSSVHSFTTPMSRRLAG